MNPTQLHVIKFFYCAALVWGWVWRVISLDSFIKEKQKKKKKKKRPIQEIKEKKQWLHITLIQVHQLLDSNLTCLFLRSLNSPGAGVTTVSMIGTASFPENHFIFILWASILFFDTIRHTEFDLLLPSDVSGFLSNGVLAAQFEYHLWGENGMTLRACKIINFITQFIQTSETWISNGELYN